MSNSDTAVLEETKGCAAPPSDLPFTGHCDKGVFPSDFRCDTGLGQLHGISLGCPTMSRPTCRAGGMHWDRARWARAAAPHHRGTWAHWSLPALRAPTRRERILPIKLTKQHAIKLHHVRELPEMPQKAVISLATVRSLISPFPRYRNCCSLISKALEIPTHKSKGGTLGNFATAVAEL